MPALMTQALEQPLTEAERDNRTKLKARYFWEAVSGSLLELYKR